MKFSVALLAIAAANSISALPISRRGVNVALVPEFGHEAGLNPTGTGDCDGIRNPAGVIVKIPCNCPPPREDFLAVRNRLFLSCTNANIEKALNANVAAGHAVNNPSVTLSFPEDDSPASQLARVTATLATLQNLKGPGVGCPAASTTLVAKQKSLADKVAGKEEDEGEVSPPATDAPVVGGVDPALVPALGHEAGLNPTGTGDCDGIADATGKAIKIPCICPPSAQDFLKSLNANVAAGFAVNNPSVSVTFPTGNSKADKLDRIQAALSTLQNLRGPGVGCPAASTTLVAQRKAILAGVEGAPAVLPSPDGQGQTTPDPAPGPGAPIVNEADIPEFGHAAGLNPTGTGDCDGIPNAAGVPIKVPCSCPPNRQTFINSLRANVAAGQAVNNPTVKIAFPEGTSKEAKLARMHASLVTLQNLNGPGRGCPAASTTFVQQQQAITRGP